MCNVVVCMVVVLVLGLMGVVLLLVIFYGVCSDLCELLL